MLAASIHEHAGLGNQLWRYVSCRVFRYDFIVVKDKRVFNMIEST